jgi:hypothetical protein
MRRTFMVWPPRSYQFDALSYPCLDIQLLVVVPEASGWHGQITGNSEIGFLRRQHDTTSAVFVSDVPLIAYEHVLVYFI